MTYCSFALRWENYLACFVNSRSALKLWVWESTQTRQKYSVTRTRRRQEKSRSTKSKLKYWRKETVRYLCQRITFEEQETEEIKNRLKAAWAAFHKYRQELTSKDYRLCHRLRLFNMVITPTMTYASGTWTLTLKHEKMIKTAQRKMLRLILQKKIKQIEKQKRSSGQNGAGDDKERQAEKQCATDKETEEGSDQNSDKDQDSDVSFQEAIDSTEKKKIGLNTSREVPKKQKNT